MQTSWGLTSLHDMLNINHATATGSIDNCSAGPGPSLVITRNISKALGVQTFIPSRLIQGIIPDALLTKYRFWQSEDGNLVGYLVDTPRNPDEASFLEVQMENTSPTDDTGFCTSTANATIRKVPGHAILDDQKPLEEAGRFREKGMWLVNLLYARFELASLRALAMRMDNLSNCLVWTEDGTSISLVEFPRLNLSFRATYSDLDGMRLYSEDHAGLFVSNFRAPKIDAMLDGLPTSVLLENSHHEFSILLPSGTKPSRPVVDDASFATSFILERSNAEWLRNLGDVRHYLYPVHPCGAFLATTTLPSTLYLLLMRFLARQYDQVAHIAQSCVSDTTLSNEEAQIFSQLSTIADDCLPDAWACRLKLSLVLSGAETTMQCPWTALKQYEEYVRRRKYVSAACRLTHAEELTIIENGVPSVLEMSNRKSFLLGMKANPSNPIVRMQYPSKPRGVLHLDRLVDRTCVQPTIKEAILGKLGTVSYTRPIALGTPEQSEGKMIGDCAMDNLHRWIGRGLKLHGGKDNLGFLFFYELLNGTIAFKILQNDSTHMLANVLLRLLPEEDTFDCMLLSILRVLAENPELAARAPKYENPKKGMFSTMFKGSDHFSSFITKVKQFLEENQQQIYWFEPYPIIEHWLMTGIPGSGHPVELQCPASIEFSSLRLDVTDRTWVTPQIPDLGCEARYLQPRTAVTQAGIDLSVTSETINAFATLPLAGLGLQKLVTQCSRKDGNLPPVANTLPFHVDKHPSASTHVARSMVSRLTDDVNYFANTTNSKTEPRIVKFLDVHLRKIAAQPKSSEAKDAEALIVKLIDRIDRHIEKDIKFVDAVVDYVVQTANNDVTPTDHRSLAQALGQQSMEECTVTFEMLVGLLMSANGGDTLQHLNPCLSSQGAETLQDLTVAAMLTVNRVALAIRCKDLAYAVLHVLRNLDPSIDSATSKQSVERELKLKSSTLASALVTHRQCIHQDQEGAFYYDPRFLVFEFVHSIMLRGQQHNLVLKFINSVKQSKSLCHQMIMGAGKTTVVGPLLALLLGDGNRLVIQVVPGQLLEFSRGVLRETFSAVIRKAVYTFVFNRTAEASAGLVTKLSIAKASRAIVTSTPTAVKSFVIKFVELLHIIDYESIRDKNVRRQTWSLAKFFGLKHVPPQREYTVDDLQNMRAECKNAVIILQYFQEGALLLDEVDLILHPLKSELNWPLGDKIPLDLTMNRSGPGLRWQIPFVLLDAIQYYTTGRMTIELVDSRDAVKVVQDIKGVIDTGCRSKVVQTTPHVVVLDRTFYHLRLRPLLSRWILLWLKESRLRELTFEQAYGYLTDTDVSVAAVNIRNLCSDDNFKILNLTRDYLMSFMPFVLGKINRVSFGLLMPSDLERAKKLHPR
jgi:hypothetical protein